MTAAAVLAVASPADASVLIARAIWSTDTAVGNAVGGGSGGKVTGHRPRPADPERLVGPLARLHDAAASGEMPAQERGTIRHRYRQLSYYVLAPLTGLGTDTVTGGEVVVTEDSDDDVATTIVYRFASDGTVAASAPGGGLIGAFDATTTAYREALRDAPRHRISLVGRE